MLNPYRERIIQPPPTDKGHRTTKAEDKKAAEMEAKGYTIQQIAEKLRISTMSAWRAVRKGG